MNAIEAIQVRRETWEFCVLNLFANDVITWDIAVEAMQANPYRIEVTA
jgi:hypothetical protein